MSAFLLTRSANVTKTPLWPLPMTLSASQSPSRIFLSTIEGLSSIEIRPIIWPLASGEPVRLYVAFSVAKVCVKISFRGFILLSKAVDSGRTDHGQPFTSKSALYLIWAPLVLNIISN